MNKQKQLSAETSVNELCPIDLPAILNKQKELSKCVSEENAERSLSKVCPNDIPAGLNKQKTMWRESERTLRDGCTMDMTKQL